MSIGKRFVHLVRSNLNSLLDKTAEWEGGPGSSVRIEDLSDAELEAELSRRKHRREAATHAAREAASSASSRTYEQAAWEEVEQAVHGSERYRTAGQRPPRGRRTGGHQATGQAGRDARRARLYAQLECPYGADADTVRKHYRVMMRKYHPDMHSKSPQKQRLATELSQKLTAAYNELRRSL